MVGDAVSRLPGVRVMARAHRVPRNKTQLDLALLRVVECS